jgi:predicted nucleotidyltransferase component of viral defense system
MTMLADKFGSHAILKGGMQLRLVDCPRFTNDLDYVFIPFSSKKEILARILDVLRAGGECNVTSTINSKCIRYRVAQGALEIQVEVNVALACESQALSTASFARAHNLQGRIIRVMNFKSALAHKLAAWNERNLCRDLYDIYYLAVILHTTPDRQVLGQRLLQVESRKKGLKKTVMSMDDFITKLETAAATLTQKMVDNELRDYMPPQELPGLNLKIKGGIQRVIDCLRG